MTELRRLDEFVVLGDEHFGERFWRSQKYAFCIECVAVADQALVWNLLGPFALRVAADFFADVVELTKEPVIALKLSVSGSKST